MSDKVRLLIVIVLLIAGIIIMVYPSMSNYINLIHSSYAVQEFHEQLSGTNSATLEEQRRLATEYNEALAGGAYDPEVEEFQILQDYEQILDFGNGIMGYIQIPKINVELSIYHGVSDTVLQKGVGHVSHSAFPIGGPGNHTVLTGHTGLPSAELFTDLTELEEGDQFYISILNDKLVYEVDQITVVLPHEVDELSPTRGRDYCTLVTCTPYGINSHRLLVRGERVQMNQSGTIAHIAEDEEDGVDVPIELILAGAAIALLLVAAVIILVRPTPKKSDPEAADSNPQTDKE